MYFPNGSFTLLPDYIITVAGNRLQIDNFTNEKNNIELDRTTLKTIHQYAKKQDEDSDSKIKCLSLVIDQSSGLYGKSLLQSEIGKRGSCCVVGIERNSGYWINPPASEIFKGGDIVWLVGNKESIFKLVNENLYFE